MKNKIIQSLSGLGIFLVVLGHSRGVTPAVASKIAGENSLYYYWLHIIKIIFTFHMPLFFCISGFLYVYTNVNFNSGWPEFIKKKLLRLLVPFVVISSFAYPIKVVMSSFAIRPQEFSTFAYFKSLLQPWNNTIIYFWFLPTLFFVYIFAKLLIRKDKLPIWDGALLVFSLACFFIFDHKYTSGFLAYLNIGGVLHHFMFFVIGALASKYCSAYLTSSSNAYWLSIPFFVIVPIYHVAGKNPTTAILMAVSGILLCYAVAKNDSSGFFHYLRKYSYQIFLLSWFPQVFVRIVFGQFLFVNIWLNVFLSLFLGLVAPIALSIIISSFNNRRLRLCFGL